MKRFLVLAMLLATLAPVFGQLDNRVFEDRRIVDEADSGKLFLGVNMLGFGKNNEYEHTIIQGYTLFGYQFNPYLSYFLTPHIRIEGGIYLQKDFGNSNITTTAPTLSLKYQKKNFALTFGNLDGSLNHRLIEPLYDFERVLNHRLENGMQAQLIRDDIFWDTWVDWNKMIYVNDRDQEQLTAGMNFNKRVINQRSTQWWIPVQLLVHHKGGEINFQHSGPIETLFNSAVGAEMKHQSTGLIRETRVNGYYLFYQTINNVRTQPFHDGSGQYFNATASTKLGLDVMVSYWRGHEFISIEGGKIYPSVSTFDYTHQQHMMQLLIFRFLYSVRVANGLYASARVEPYFDLQTSSFQYSYGVYLNYRDRFFLWKRNKS